MTDTDALVFECALDAPPEKVWRALTVPEYLERWLKPAEAIDLAVVTAEENKSLTYRWRESGQGAIIGAEDSLVTFELTPMVDGGTWFRLTHAPVTMPVAANSNGPMRMMMAA
ncbi:SRPBCC family protein [Devosia sp. SL43]|uniref:SRPBCC family protein n=1 Tax=Devosia sp. SL43 TaxID=2806348 RepID=UPI001F4813C3|nr:SRPBCC domain-containing protein [Devosia sp. SL43]UJW86580.1 SRPBCC domain-containing protein [Devosia sp. SL43]